MLVPVDGTGEYFGGSRAAFEMRVDSWKLWTPLTIIYALFGYFLSEKTGGMAVFEKPA